MLACGVCLDNMESIWGGGKEELVSLATLLLYVVWISVDYYSGTLVGPESFSKVRLPGPKTLYARKYKLGCIL